MIEFEDADKLILYIAVEVAEFVRDNMPELNQHPFDYQDHYDYIEQLYLKWRDREYDL